MVVWWLWTRRLGLHWALGLSLATALVLRSSTNSLMEVPFGTGSAPRWLLVASITAVLGSAVALCPASVIEKQSARYRLPYVSLQVACGLAVVTSSWLTIPHGGVPAVPTVVAVAWALSGLALTVEPVMGSVWWAAPTIGALALFLAVTSPSTSEGTLTFLFSSNASLLGATLVLTGSAVHVLHRLRPI